MEQLSLGKPEQQIAHELVEQKSALEKSFAQVHLIAALVVVDTAEEEAVVEQGVVQVVVTPLEHPMPSLQAQQQFQY